LLATLMDGKVEIFDVVTVQETTEKYAHKPYTGVSEQFI